MVLVNRPVDVFEDLIVLDDGLQGIDFRLRPTDADTLPDEDQALQVGLDGETEPRRQLDCVGVEELSESQDGRHKGLKR